MISSRSGRPTQTAEWVVWCCWFVCTSVAFTVVMLYGNRLPFSDDWDLVPAIVGQQPLTFEWLWSQHNEHRIVIPRLVMVMAARVGGGDFRATLLVNAACLSGLAALLIIAVKRVRGKTSLTDVFLPCYILHLGQGGLRWGFLFQSVCATVAVGVIAGVLALNRWPTSKAHSVVLATAVLVLPLSGANGVVYIPVIALLFVVLGAMQWKPAAGAAADVAARRFGSVLIIAASATAVMITGLLFVNYTAPVYAWPSASVLATLTGALRFCDGSLRCNRWSLLAIFGPGSWRAANGHACNVTSGAPSGDIRARRNVWSLLHCSPRLPVSLLRLVMGEARGVGIQGFPRTTRQWLCPVCSFVLRVGRGGTG